MKNKRKIMSVNIEFNSFFDKTFSEYTTKLYNAFSKCAKINIKNQIKNRSFKEVNLKITKHHLLNVSQSYAINYTKGFQKAIQKKFEAWKFFEGESIWMEEEIEKMIINLLAWCENNYSTPDQIKAENDRYAKEYYKTCIKPFKMTRKEANQVMQFKRRNKSKSLVLKVANALKEKDHKITIENIHCSMVGKDKISKSRVGVYLKELRDENKI